jgi:ligand-binding sensor domain-containing protein
MWFGTDYGLVRYDGYKFVSYKPDNQHPDRIGNIYSWSIIEDAHGDIWIGTYGRGLYHFDYEKERFFNYKNDPDDQYSISNNFIPSICQSPADSGNVLWIGTRWGGLNKFNLKTKKFLNNNSGFFNFSDQHTKNIFTINIDREGILYLGTVHLGLIQYDLVSDTLRCYAHNPRDENSLSNNQVRSIYQDKSGIIWIGTHGGLNRFDKDKKEFHHYVSKPNDQNSLSDNNVISIQQDKYGYLWVGTFNGLNILNPETEKITRVYSDLSRSNSVSYDYISSIYQDESGIMWVGTHGGINKHIPSTKNFATFRIIAKDYSHSNINSVRSIQVDITDENILWIGTDGAGLVKHNHNNGTYTHYGYRSYRCHS